MPQSGTIEAKEVTSCLLRPLNVLRGIEVDLAGHPDCPFRAGAREAVNDLMGLMEKVEKSMAKKPCAMTGYPVSE